MRYSFAYQPYRRTFRHPVRTAHGVWTEREGIFVRITDAGGRAGYGEIAPLPDFGTETLAEAAEFCRRLGAEIDADGLALVPERLGCVRCALGFALAEVGDTTPVATTAGAAKRLPVAALLPAGRAALPVLTQRLEAGYLAFKWKVGVGRAEEELPVLDDLLAQLPAYARLRLDANGAWDRRTAERWLERCAECPVEFVEQPAAPAQVDLLLGLAQDYPVTLALDEAVANLAAARDWQARGWPGVFVLKPAIAGAWSDVTAWIRTTQADVVFSSALETALGRAQIVRRLAAGDGLTRRALGFGVGELFGDRRWDGPPVGPLLDAAWGEATEPVALWNAAS